MSSAADGPFIPILDEASAPPDVAALLARYRNPVSGRADNILAIHGLRPDSLVAHVRFYSTVMHGKGGLSSREREILAVVCSSANHCFY